MNRSKGISDMTQDPSSIYSSNLDEWNASQVSLPFASIFQFSLLVLENGDRDELLSLWLLELLFISFSLSVMVQFLLYPSNF